jgi:hypothetical protein
MKTAHGFLTGLVMLLVPIALSEGSEPHHFFRVTSNTPGSVHSGTLRYQRGNVTITG